MLESWMVDNTMCTPCSSIKYIFEIESNCLSPRGPCPWSWSYRSGTLIWQMMVLRIQSQSTPSFSGMAPRCYSRREALLQVVQRNSWSIFKFLVSRSLIPTHLHIRCCDCTNCLGARFQHWDTNHQPPTTKHILKILVHLSFQLPTQEFLLVPAFRAKYLSQCS